MLKNYTTNKKGRSIRIRIETTRELIKVVFNNEIKKEDPLE